MSSRKRRSSEYSISYGSNQSSYSKKGKISDQAKKDARRHLYKVCFKDWLAIVGIIPALATGIMPILFIYFSTDLVDSLQSWGYSNAVYAVAIQNFPEASGLLASQPAIQFAFPDVADTLRKCASAADFQKNSLKCTSTLVGFVNMAAESNDPALQLLMKNPKMAGLAASIKEQEGLINRFINEWNGQGYDPMPDVVRVTKHLAIVCAVQAALMFFDTLIWTMVGTRVENRMKIDMYTNLMKSEVSYFDITPVGNILTLLSEDAEAIEIAFGNVKATQFAAVVQGISGLVFALVRKWDVALISIAFVPVVIIALLICVPFILKHSAIKFKNVSESMTIAEETLGAIRTVRGFTREEVEIHRFMKATKEAARRDKYIGLIVVVFLLVVLVSTIGDELADFYYGATIVDKGKLEFGKLVTLFLYTLLGALGVVSLQGTMQGEEKCIAGGARILEVTEHISDIPFDGGEIIEDFKGEIEFKNVSFKYPTRDAYVLKNVSFKIASHQIGALVGHSGSGKSTCVQLLERFYDVTEGYVLLDGKDIRTLDQHWLHTKIALVSQEPVLFHMTLRENLKYGAHDATDEEILAAIEIANAKKVIDKLEHGLDQMIGEKGESLSGGQRQRIAIARAVVKNPLILITDEATSALDSQSEKKVQIALDKVMQNCTSVIVAHRLSTIRNAHIIYVFDAGEIKESGTHDELVKKGGYYYNLVYRQLTDKDAKQHDAAQGNDDEDSDESPKGGNKKVEDVSTDEDES